MKILFVSYNHAKPYVADSVQNHRLAEALSEFHEVEVLQRSLRRVDEGVWSPNLYIIDRAIYKIMPFLISVFSVDAYIWCKMAYRSIAKKIREYDYVMMFYEPYTTRFLSFRIHKSTELKVMSVLYDPYYDNIFFSNSKIGKLLRKKIEKRIVEESDAVVVNNDKVLDLFRQRFPDNAVFKVNFCGFPENRLPQIARDKKSTVKTLVHSGNIFGARRIDEINDVVTLLKAKITNLPEQFQILLVGTYCVNYEYIIKSENQDVIKFLGPRYGEELAKIITESDGFLLIDPLNEYNCCLPSKLSEYYQHGKPIFAISAKNTPSYISLRQSNNVVCDESELEVMVLKLVAFINDSTDVGHPMVNNLKERYYPQTIAGEYSRILNLTN